MVYIQYKNVYNRITYIVIAGQFIITEQVDLILAFKLVIF